MRFIPILTAALAAALGAGTAAAPGAAIPNLARNLAATCANCHGTNGVSQGGTEIARRRGARTSIVRKMQEFKSGREPGDDHAPARQGLHRRADRARRRLVRGAEAGQVRRRP